MGLVNITLKNNMKIPLFDLATLAAGFWIGYNEGKGIPVPQELEMLTKYGPTLFAAASVPISTAIGKTVGKVMYRGIRKALYKGDFQVKQKDGKCIKFGQLDKDEQEKTSTKMRQKIDNLEEKIQNKTYIAPTLKATGRTAAESIVGYIAGRLYSQVA